jgi:multiple sugar transport system permease protein
MRILGLIVFLAFFLFPIAFLLATSFKTPDQVLAGGFFPLRPVLDNWPTAFEKVPLAMFLRNSVVAALAAGLLTLVITVPAVYAVEKLRIAHGWLPNFVLGVYLAPPVVALLPLFFMLRFAGLLDTIPGLVLVFGLMNIPVAFWLLRPFVISVPREIDEASWVDGAGFWRTLISINLPLLLPALVATGLICMILSYNEFLFASTFTFSDEARTLTVGVSLFQGDRLVNFGQMAVASLTAIIPVYFVALLFQRWLIGGLTAGGVK